MDKPKEEEMIPQIKPENSLPEDQGPITKEEPTDLSSPAPAAAPESILIPKELKPQTKVESPPPPPEKPRFRINLPKGRGVKILAGIGLGLVILLGALAIPAYTIYGKAMKVKAAALKLTEAAKGQNIDTIKTELGSTKTSLAELRNSFRLVAWTKFIPFFGLYVRDADQVLKAGTYGLEAAEITLVTIEPYADILGFSGGKVQGIESDGAKTAQERIDFLVHAIPDLVPKADEISRKVTLARQELANIDPNRYPVKFRGQPVREKIRKGLGQVTEVATLVSAAKPLLEVSPYLLGIEEERRYLVIFQNDKELRPTGGFITAYSVMKVDKAKFEPVSSNDIYNLDDNYRPSLTVPDPIAAYIKGPYTLSKGWRLRDMNWSPDFGESMDLFSQEAAKAGIKGVDGIIAVDTHLLVNLLDAIGEIGVSGFGNFSTKIVPECDCPQVIYELESFADTEGPIVWSQTEPGKIVYAPPNYDNRKRIIGPLMNSILANAMGQPKEKLP